MARYREYYPQEDSPQFFGDRGFAAWDARTAPEKLPEGTLSRSINLWLEDGCASTRPGVPFCDWSLVQPPVQILVPPAQAYDPWQEGLTYYLGARVVVDGSPDHTWELTEVMDVPESEEALTEDGNWTDLGTGNMPKYKFQAPLNADGDEVLVLRHAVAFTEVGGSVPWVARAYDGTAWVSRPGSDGVEIPYPEGEVAPAGSRLLSALGMLFLFRGPELEPWVWESVGSFVPISSVFPGAEDERVTQPLVGGQVVLEHRGRILVGRGSELYVSDILEGVYAPLASVEEMPGGAGDITALISLGPDVLVFRQLGIFRVSGLDTVDLWTITPVTYAKGAVGPDAVALAGEDVWFMADDGVYSLRQVRDQGENRLGVGDVAVSLPVSNLMSRLLAAPYRAQVRVAVFGPRVMWAIPVGVAPPRPASPEGAVLHRVFVWRQDVKVWESLWAQGPAVATDANFQPDTDEEVDWQIQAWVTTLVNGVETLLHADDAGIYHWLSGVYDDCRPWDIEANQLDSPHEWVASRARTRGLGWESENGTGTRTSQRVRIEGSTWAPNYDFCIMGADGRRNEDPLKPRTHSARKGLKSGMRAFDLTNANDDHSTDGREDYAVNLPATTPVLNTVTALDARRMQQFVWHVRAGGDGRFFQVEIANNAGVFSLACVGYEAKVVRRSSLTRTS